MHLSAKKGLGQHFLMHRQTSERIVLAANVTERDTVLEIGPGTGVLTRELLAKAGKVYAVETDAELIPRLEATFAEEIASGKLVLIHIDVRKFDPSTIDGPYLLVANIPYYITGEIVRQFLTTTHKPSSMTLLVQKEVAERVARSEKESLLSLSVKAYGTPKYEFTVPKGAFVPAPKVDSAVLSVRDITATFQSPNQEARFFAILRAGFAHKRKRLMKNLEAVAEKGDIQEAFAAALLHEDIRPEDVPLAGWTALAESLKD